MYRPLLERKLRDFNLNLNSILHTGAIDILKSELKRKELLFDPHIWIGDEWFSPTGVTGFAIPFYMFNRDLLNLEKKFIGFAEGENKEHFLKLLRHECAHAIDHAYFFKDDQNWKDIFGNYNRPYPQSYTFKKYTKNFVKHLPEGYAQSHPEEDWAETFAVWLNPSSQWRRKYEGWGCIHKLNYLDQLMKNYKNQKPNIILNKEIDSYEECDITLEEYFERKIKHYKLKERPSTRHLRAIAHKDYSGEPLHDLLKLYEKQLSKKLSKDLNTTQYMLNKVLSDLKKTAKAEKLNINNKMTSKKDPSKILEECTFIHYEKVMRNNRHRVIM